MSTVADKFDDVDEFESLLEDAEMNAETDWEEGFVSDMSARYEQHGDAMFLSEAQLLKLESIANKE